MKYIIVSDKSPKNMELEQIFQKYSTLKNDITVGDILRKTILPPLQPEKTLDLHGFFAKEAQDKIQIFLHNARHKHIFIRIITGKGTGVLQNIVKKILQEKISQKKIVCFRENEHGFFDVFFK